MALANSYGSENGDEVDEHELTGTECIDDGERFEIDDLEVFVFS